MAKQLTVPPEYQGSFRREALFALESAAGNVDEAARWLREGRGDGGEARLDRELTRFSATLAMFMDVRAGEFTIAAEEGMVEEQVLESACQGCLLEAVDQAKGGAEGVDHSTVLPLLDEAKFWLDQLDGKPALTVA